MTSKKTLYDLHIERGDKVQGKCNRCRVCYRWLHTKTSPRLKEAYCPTCSGKLRQTSYLKKWPWIEDVEPIKGVIGGR